MGELRFVVDSQQPVTVQNFLRNGNGISARLLKKLKNRNLDRAKELGKEYIRKSSGMNL